MLFLCVGVIFGRRHTFRSQHIGQSKAMRQRGIHCVESMDAIERKTYRGVKAEKRSDNEDDK